MHHAIATYSPRNLREIMSTLGRNSPKFFTFNDDWFTPERPRSVQFVFSELLPALFPEPSQYELPDVL
jgi:hypothetical protein